MIRICLLAITFLVFLTFISQAQSNEADKQELTRILHEFLVGASKNDKAIHDSFWAEDLIYTSSAGLRFGKQKIMGNFDQQVAVTSDIPTTTYTAEDIIIQQYGDMAIVAFKMKGVSNANIQFFLNSGTFLKRNGKWQVVNWQATMANE